MSLPRHRRNGSNRAGSLLPALSLAGPSHLLQCSVALARLTQIALPVRPGPPDDAPVKERRPTAQGAFRRVLDFAVPPGSSRHQLPANQLRASSRKMIPLEACAPIRHLPTHCPRQRCNGFLPARSCAVGSSCDSPMPTTQDASDRLLPLVTLTTSTHASCVPDS